MRTRNKAKEQTTNKARPKRGGTETPEPKTPIKSSQNADKTTPTQGGTTPGKKKNKSDKPETPTKNKDSRKRQQDNKSEEIDIEERDLGLLKKKRDRAESPCSLTTDSETVNDDVENPENEIESTEANPPCGTGGAANIATSAVSIMLSYLLCYLFNGIKFSFELVFIK